MISTLKQRKYKSWLTKYIDFAKIGTIKTLKQIDQKVRKILEKGIMVGMKNGVSEIASNPIYTDGVGIDIRHTVINASVQHELKKAVLAAKEPTLSAQTVEHSRGHSMMIRYAHFIIFPKRVDYKSDEKYEREEASYHKKLMMGNPTKQGEFFVISDPETSIFVQLRFGENKQGFFASLRIPDSVTGGIFDEEKLELQSTVILAPEEKTNKPKNMTVRSEKVSGQ